jgi:hypothetical protein
MSKEHHTRAAEAHEQAAKTHRTAAQHHDKGDHANIRIRRIANPRPRIGTLARRARAAKILEASDRERAL